MPKNEKIDLPPMLQVWVEGLNDKSNDVYQRDNYRRQIEDIVEELNNNLKRHKKEMDSARLVGKFRSGKKVYARKSN